MSEHSCPVCRKGISPCAHMLDAQFFDAARGQALSLIEHDARSPVEAGIARFAAEAIAMQSLARRCIQ